MILAAANPAYGTSGRRVCGRKSDERQRQEGQPETKQAAKLPNNIHKNGDLPAPAQANAKTLRLGQNCDYDAS